MGLPQFLGRALPLHRRSAPDVFILDCIFYPRLHRILDCIVHCLPPEERTKCPKLHRTLDCTFYPRLHFFLDCIFCPILQWNSSVAAMCVCVFVRVCVCVCVCVFVCVCDGVCV